MAIYSGAALVTGDISIHAPDHEALRRALVDARLTGDEVVWFERAQHDGTVLYFAVSYRNRIVGQVMLHDIVHDDGTAMVGYHIFRESDRDRGIGSTALALLCAYAFVEMGLRRLVAITGAGNTASRRIAEKVGFTYVGPAREGQHLVVYERHAPEE